MAEREGEDDSWNIRLRGKYIGATRMFELQGIMGYSFIPNFDRWNWCVFFLYIIIIAIISKFYSNLKIDLRGVSQYLTPLYETLAMMCERGETVMRERKMVLARDDMGDGVNDEREEINIIYIYIYIYWYITYLSVVYPLGCSLQLLAQLLRFVHGCQHHHYHLAQRYP